jgi:hypothetical protein
MGPQQCRIPCCPASTEAAQGDSAGLPDEPLRRKGDNQKTTMPLPPRPITDHDRDVLVTRSWFSHRHEGDKPAKIVAKFIAADQQPLPFLRLAADPPASQAEIKQNVPRRRTLGKRSAIA